MSTEGGSGILPCPHQPLHHYSSATATLGMMPVCSANLLLQPPMGGRTKACSTSVLACILSNRFLSSQPLVQRGKVYSIHRYTCFCLHLLSFLSRLQCTGWGGTGASLSSSDSFPPMLIYIISSLPWMWHLPFCTFPLPGAIEE